MDEPGIIVSLLPLIFLYLLWISISRLRKRARNNLGDLRDLSRYSNTSSKQASISTRLAEIASCSTLAIAFFFFATSVLRFTLYVQIPYSFELMLLIGVGIATALSISANNSPLIGRKKASSRPIALFNKFGTTLLVAALGYAMLQNALQSFQFDERDIYTEWPVGPFQLTASLLMLLAAAVSVFRLLEQQEDR